MKDYNYIPKFSIEEWEKTTKVMGSTSRWELEECGLEDLEASKEVMDDIKQYIQHNCTVQSWRYYDEGDDIDSFKNHKKKTEWGYELDGSYQGFSGPDKGPLKEYSILLAKSLDESYDPEN